MKAGYLHKSFAKERLKLVPYNPLSAPRDVWNLSMLQHENSFRSYRFSYK